MNPERIVQNTRMTSTQKKTPPFPSSCPPVIGDLSKKGGCLAGSSGAEGLLVTLAENILAIRLSVSQGAGTLLFLMVYVWFIGGAIPTKGLDRPWRSVCKPKRFSKSFSLRKLGYIGLPKGKKHLLQVSILFRAESKPPGPKASIFHSCLTWMKFFHPNPPIIHQDCKAKVLRRRGLRLVQARFVSWFLCGF